jgi:hypothetical protein
VSDLTTNREAIRRLMIDYFRLRASEAARTAVLNRGRIGSPGGNSQENLRRLQAARNFMDAFTDESERAREQTRHLERAALDALDAQDDDAFRLQLRMIVPPTRDSEE